MFTWWRLLSYSVTKIKRLIRENNGNKKEYVVEYVDTVDFPVSSEEIWLDLDLEQESNINILKGLTVFKHLNAKRISSLCPRDLSVKDWIILSYHIKLWTTLQNVKHFKVLRMELKAF